MEHVNILKAIAIIYGIPLIALIVGTVGSYYILDNVVTGNTLQICSMAVGLIFTAVSYLCIKLKDAKFRESRKYMPTVTRIVIDLDMADMIK